MEITQTILVGLQIIGVATVALRIVAPLTKTKWDNRVLDFLTKVLKAVSLNLDESELRIKVK